jgi:outer membrane protein assembly factor BamB
MKKLIALSLICLTSFVAGASAVAPSNWSQWRGDDGTGVSTETNVTLDWGADRNVRWKTTIPGRGHSSPVVWANRVFLTSDLEGEVVPGAKAVDHTYDGKPFKHPDSIGGDRKHTMKVIAIDRDSGRILWEQSAFEGTVYDDRHRKGSFASPTPAVDANFVFAYFGTEGLYCYDHAGKQIWKTTPGKLGTIGMGTGTSPVLFENLVILQCDEENGERSFVIAYDRKTGKEVWKTPRKVQASWSTPLLVRAAGGTQLVTSGNELIVSYDAKTGTELWQAKGHESNAIPSPVAGHGLVFVSAGFPVKRTVAIKSNSKGDVSNSSQIAWRYDKGTAYVPSTILVGDYLYLMTDRGIITCLEATTGKVVYEGGRVPVPASFTASPVAVDGKILLTSEDGDTFVIKAGRTHEVIATNSLNEPVFASPAISNGMIFIRGEKNLYCIGGKAK